MLVGTVDVGAWVFRSCTLTVTVEVTSECVRVRVKKVTYYQKKQVCEEDHPDNDFHTVTLGRQARKESEVKLDRIICLSGQTGHRRLFPGDIVHSLEPGQGKVV